MQTKVCSKCTANKPLAEFYLNKAMHDSLDYCCKDCRKLYAREHYYINRNERLNRIRAYREERLLIDPNFDSRNTAKMNAKYPEKLKARGKARYAVSAGKLKPGNNCAVCATSLNLELHHADYNRPFDVILLCRKCHMQHHIDLREEQRNG